MMEKAGVCFDLIKAVQNVIFLLEISYILHVSDDKPASIDDNKKGKCAVDKYYGEDGKEVAFDADDRKKLNELLNEIEKIAER